MENISLLGERSSSVVSITSISKFNLIDGLENKMRF